MISAAAWSAYGFEDNAGNFYYEIPIFATELTDLIPLACNSLVSDLVATPSSLPPFFKAIARASLVFTAPLDFNLC